MKVYCRGLVYACFMIVQAGFNKAWLALSTRNITLREWQQRSALKKDTKQNTFSWKQQLPRRCCACMKETHQQPAERLGALVHIAARLNENLQNSSQPARALFAEDFCVPKETLRCTSVSSRPETGGNKTFLLSAGKNDAWETPGLELIWDETCRGIFPLRTHGAEMV